MDRRREWEVDGEGSRFVGSGKEEEVVVEQ